MIVCRGVLAADAVNVAGSMVSFEVIKGIEDVPRLLDVLGIDE